MNFIIGLLMILTGAALGVYLGIWWAFIGGIIDVIRGATATNVDAMMVALGVAKVFFSGLIGWCSAAVLIIPGNYTMNLK